jgi:hypothetical protein
MREIGAIATALEKRLKGIMWWQNSDIENKI